MTEQVAAEDLRLIAEFRRHLEAQGKLAANTVDQYERDVKRLARSESGVQAGGLDRIDRTALERQLANSASRKSEEQARYGLRCFFRFRIACGGRQDDPTQEPPDPENERGRQSALTKGAIADTENHSDRLKRTATASKISCNQRVLSDFSSIADRV